MSGFLSIGALAAANEGGRTHAAHFRKLPGQATVAGWWTDLSMSPGNPRPNYYASTPLQATTLEGFEGLFHGDDKAPASKHLVNLGLMTPNTNFVGQFKLLDYLLYYPFVDGDDPAEQTMDNTVTLPRYASEGGQVMAVCGAPTTGGGMFTFTYINQDGGTAVSPVQGCSTTAAGIGALLTTQPAVALSTGPFLNLANGDTAVKRIESVQFLTASGGLMTLVIVADLADAAIREAGTVAEVPFVNQRPGAPQVYDGAYLNLICNGAASLAGATLSGYLNFVWST